MIHMKKLVVLVFLVFLQPSGLGAWSPTGERIRTRWAAEVSENNCLPEYPRPQMVRSEWQNLNGLWKYAITSTGSDYSLPDGDILVPFCVESSLSGVGRNVGPEQLLWYERTFSIPKSWRNKEIILHFGAVDWAVEIWLNDSKVGEHTGGYTPFQFNITPFLKKKGMQTIRLKVYDASDISWQPRGKQMVKPNTIWYTPVTGIWQTVWLEPVNKTHIVDYTAVSDFDNKKFSVDVKAEGLIEGDIVRIELLEGSSSFDAFAPAGAVISSAEATHDAQIMIPKEKMHYWTPDDPYLYGLRISIVRDGKVEDQVKGYTAARKISVRKDPKPDRNMKAYMRLALNNRRMFQFGLLDQGWWPDGLYTAPTDEALYFDIKKTKDWGFNTIRKHVKVEPARWYYHCDRLGVIVWQDMPNMGDHDRWCCETRPAEMAKAQENKWSQGSLLGGTDCDVPQEWKDNFYKEWGEVIASLRYFPSICVWTPFNEAWGQFDTRDVVEFTHLQDSTRLVNESAGGNYELCGDIHAVHHYAAPAMNSFEWRMANVISEFGGLGYPVPGHTWENDANWGYGKTLDDSSKVLELYSRFADMLKTYIMVGCTGAIYTQTTDVEIEVNGIMTYDREVVKLDEEKLKEINQSVINSINNTL